MRTPTVRQIGARPYEILKHFSKPLNGYSADAAINYDGWLPIAPPILSGGKLYGTTKSGGTNGSGTVYCLNTNGTGYVVIKSFSWTFEKPYDGQTPLGPLLLVSNTLYGTTAYGGVSNSNNGTVFKVNIDGTGYQIIHSFSTFPDFRSTNMDGAHPRSALMISSNTLFGTARDGGVNAGGTAFKINLDGTSFAILHSFGSDGDGFVVGGGLVLAGNTLFGTTAYGGSNSTGAIFRMNTDGSGYSLLKHFSALTYDPFLGYYRSIDGQSPLAGLMLAGGTLFGTTSGGGTNGNGTAFKINTDGSGFSTLHNFGDSPNGSRPESTLVVRSNVLYGATPSGGDWDAGTVFSITLPTFPTILTQPTSRTNDSNTTATFSVLADGAAPLSYQWRKNSTNLANIGNASGAKSAMLTLTNVSPNDAGTYSVIVSNDFGTIMSSNVVLAVNVTVALPEALDSTNLPWITGGDTNWLGQSFTTHDAIDAGQSGAIGNSQSNWVQTSVTVSGTLTFWWKVSSESGYDYLSFHTNGVLAAEISGEIDWQQRTFAIGGGSQILRWVYSKDDSVSRGFDKGWLDQVTYVSSAPPLTPIWFQKSGNQFVLSWTNAAFSLQTAPTVTGVYTNIPGATSPYTNLNTGGQRFFRLIAN